MQDIQQHNFPLPRLGPKLASLQQEVVSGRGFTLLSHVPIQGLSQQQLMLLYWGIGTHWGTAVPQNAKGHMIGHVKDCHLDPSNPGVRLYATNAAQPYHTDSADLVGLLCLATARTGGQSSWCSSAALYNEMLRRDPALVHTLLEPLYVDRKGEIPEGKLPHYQMAVFHWFEGLLSTIYARGFIAAAQRHSEVPRLTPAQIAAMDLVDELAASDLLRMDYDLQPGDLQLLHNHTILHARMGGHDGPEQQRHLLRLWLSPANGRPLAPVFAERYSSTVPGQRGGIWTPEAQLSVPLDPC
eukprot:jgi/Astpho2/4809/e_gw1.00068.16.1_t